MRFLFEIPCLPYPNITSDHLLFSRNFLVLAFSFKFVVHMELIRVCDVREGLWLIRSSLYNGCPFDLVLFCRSYFHKSFFLHAWHYYCKPGNLKYVGFFHCLVSSIGPFVYVLIPYCLNYCSFKIDLDI